MNISGIKSSPAFGKTAVMECRVKNSKDKVSQDATLYKLNMNNIDDIDAVRQSKNTTAIKNDFIKAHIFGDKYNDFYMLQNDKTQEVISCAEVSHRYKTGGEEPERSTVVTSMGENKKYINGGVPIIAYLTKIAAERDDDSLYISYNIEDSSNWSDWTENEIPSLTQIKASDTGKDGMRIPSRRFLSFLDVAEKRAQINYEI
ncbi:hypothetical protein IJ182_05695 [bacterium]|nr:hypothetical protein [bacterium]